MIPATAHFIWIGNQVPWLHVLAARSAVRRGGFRTVLFHHVDALDGSPHFDSLQREPGVSCRRLLPEALLEGVRGPALVDLYHELTHPAARANVIRAALLARDGGVYLDLDTVTVASLAPLREAHRAFLGEEHVAWPGSVRRSRDPRRVLPALGRDALRDLLRRAPRGFRLFRRVAHLYPRAANNAVLGCTPGHPMPEALLDAMLALPAAERRKRFALGTHLLQALVRARPGMATILPPSVFYPLGPEISEHWFRAAPGVSYRELLQPETRVVHWYASVRTARWTNVVEPSWVVREARRRPFAALAAELL